MLHQRMFESGTYKSLPEHIALYEALEASMARAQRDEFLAKMDKSRKRRLKDIPIPDSANISDSEDTDSAHLPKIKQRPEWLKPIPDDDRPTTLEPSLTGDMRTFINWYCQKVGKTKLTQADFEGQAYEVVKAFYPDVVHLQDLEYLRYGSKGYRQALSISMMKAARYHDFGLELLVPEHMWINDVCTYDIIRTHMRILSVVGIEANSRYGYDYLKEITLRIADYQEYTIVKKDFKNLYPIDFEDLNLLLLQGHLNHLSSSDKRMLSTAFNLWTRNLVIQQRVKDLQLGIESYQKQLNLTKPGWDATGYEYKYDYTIIESPHAVVFLVSNNERKITRFNKIYKFSDGTLTNILEALHYRVKEYDVQRIENEAKTVWQVLYTSVRGTVHVSTRYCTRQYEVATVGQSKHDTCPKRVIQGCQAYVSPR
ncbi:hypothetical protein Tco_1264590 [Tanacetum coccineum]